jgi:hypothetical protein
MKWTMVSVCAAAVVAACAYAPPPVEMPSAPPPVQAGVAPGEAQQQSEAQALEQAEAKCATEGKHAVARRVEDVTVYDCVARGAADSGSQTTPKP